MASPFAKYTGEQVQPINILPYTAQIADTLRQGGASLAKGIERYRQSQAERDQLAEVASGIVGKYVEQDLQNPEDRESYKASDNAPEHSAKLINEALKEGDGDIGRGIAGVPLSKLRAWASLEQRHEQAVQRDTENRFKEQTIQLERDKGIFAKTVEDNRKAQEAERLALEKKKAEDAKRASLRTYKLQEGELKSRKEQWEADSLIRKAESSRMTEQWDAKKKEAEEAKKVDAFAREAQDVSSIPTSITVKEQSTVLEEIGDIYDQQTGELIAGGVQIRDALPALGLDPKDVVTADTVLKAKTVDKNYAFNSVGKYLTQNPKFDLASGFSGAVQNGYADTLIRSVFKQADAYSKENTGKGLSGIDRFFPQGVDSKIENVSKAYALAEKLMQDGNFVDYIKKQGVSTVPEGAVFNKAYYEITGTQAMERSVVREIPLTDKAIAKARYDQLAQAAGGANKLPLSFTQILMLQPDKFLPSSQVQLGDGSVINVTKFGTQYKTDADIIGNKSGLPETKAQLDIQSADNWLRQYERPTDIGPMTIQFAGGINAFRGDWDKDYPVLKKGFEDVRLAANIASKMREFARKGVLEKGLSPQEREEFNQLVMRATTFRKHFLAGGQETEPDAQRLFEQIGALTNITRLFSSESHLKAIDAFEATIRDQVVANSRSANFRVAVKGSGTKYDLKKVIKELEDDLKTRKSDKK
jgi:hypothetical protein